MGEMEELLQFPQGREENENGIGKLVINRGMMIKLTESPW